MGKRAARRAATWATAGLSAALVLAACATDPGVATQSAQRIETAPATTTPGSSTTDPGGPATTGPDITAPPAPTPPATTTPPTAPTDPGTTPPTVDSAIEVDVGDAKTPHDYDDYIAAVLADIQQFWIETYPAAYGGPFQLLQGKVYAGYPQRTSPIPACDGRGTTPYRDINQYSAFYCQQGDFMVYDDAPEGMLGQMASTFGQSVLGVVFAHEFGHAVQSRAGVLSQDLATIVTEQQADCFAGAWSAWANAGNGSMGFTDADVRSGLVAMIQVRDPAGVDQFSEGGHGSAFDRVGAFQAGFTLGASRCATLIEDPLPLVPNTFRDTASDGNAPFGYGTEGVVGFISDDLNLFWSDALSAEGVSIPALTVVPVQSASDVDCDDPIGAFRDGALFCAASNVVYLDEPLARDLYDRFGDFVVGYVLGGAWGEAVQQALDSPLDGEQRFLASDCLTGAWAGSIIPDSSGRTPRQAETETHIEPGDLDEAIQTALVISDESAGDDVLGSGFEQIASFRQGVLDGLGACTAQIGG